MNTYYICVRKRQKKDIQRVYIHIYEHIISTWIHIYAFTHLERDRESLYFYLKKHFYGLHCERCRK